MDQPVIYIALFSPLGKELPEKIAGALQREFRCQAIVREMRLDLSEFLDAGRRQYNADKLLGTLKTLKLDETGKMIGIFDVDLFIPILTYIFGQAQLGGQFAVASTYRLSNLRYAIPDDETLFAERLIKEVVHETGHLFGLLHCHNQTCVMRSSTYVEDIDQKDQALCNACQQLL